MLEIDCKHLLFDKRSKTFIGKLRDIIYPHGGQHYSLSAPIRVFGNTESKTFHFARTDEDPDGPYYYSFVDSDNINGLYSLELYSKDDDMIARWNSLRGEELYETTSR
jgi:hypothetical protein